MILRCTLKAKRTSVGACPAQRSTVAADGTAEKVVLPSTALHQPEYSASSLPRF